MMTQQVVFFQRDIFCLAQNHLLNSKARIQTDASFRGTSSCVTWLSDTDYILKTTTSASASASVSASVSARSRPPTPPMNISTSLHFISSIGGRTPISFIVTIFYSCCMASSSSFSYFFSLLIFESLFDNHNLSLSVFLRQHYQWQFNFCQSQSFPLLSLSLYSLLMTRYLSLSLSLVHFIQHCHSIYATISPHLSLILYLLITRCVHFHSLFFPLRSFLSFWIS